MKKPAAASLVVLAFALLHVAPAFADDAQPKKPRKVTNANAPKAAKPNGKPKKIAAPKSEPETVAAAPIEPPAPAPIAAPAAAPDAAAAPASGPPARDEPSAVRSATDEEAKPIQLAPLVGYASQGLKLGFGARASYTFSNHIAVAGTFVYHLGTSEEVASFGGQTASASSRAFYPGAEVGYDLHIEHVTIRPYAGVAALFVSVSSKLGDQESSDTNSHFAIYPGVTASYEIPQTAFFAGADMRLLIVTDGGDPSFGFFGTVGMRL